MSFVSRCSRVLALDRYSIASSSLLLAIVALIFSSFALAQTAPSCSAGQTQCGGSCVDTANDSANCGKCGSACRASDTCVKGKCKAPPRCRSNQASCGGRCTDVNKDAQNCGACGRACQPGKKCSNAVCVDKAVSKFPWPQPKPNPNPPSGTQGGPFNCPLGEEFCNGRCVNTLSYMNDDNNCGRCGNSCSAGQSCRGGFCSCAVGSTSCNGTCISDGQLMSDNNNCGRCGNMCSIGQTCMGGTCMRTTPCPPGDITCH